MGGYVWGGPGLTCPASQGVHLPACQPLGLSACMYVGIVCHALLSYQVSSCRADFARLAPVQVMESVLIRELAANKMGVEWSTMKI